MSHPARELLAIQMRHSALLTYAHDCRQRASAANEETAEHLLREALAAEAAAHALRGPVT